MQRIPIYTTALAIIIICASACAVIVIQRRLLDKKLKKIYESSRAKTHFFARTSHELRTPVNAIIGMAELALRGDLPPQAREYISSVSQSGRNLLGVINEVLDYSKIELGKTELIRDDYMPASVINDAIHTVKLGAGKPKLRFLVNVDSRIPAVLYGDAPKIHQILINLLNNAIKYTENGYVALTATAEPAGGGAVNLLVKVSDSGRGIKPGDYTKLYKEFSRLDVKENAYIEGTGLGLAITKDLLNLMGGKIDVQSVYGSGSTFTAAIPQKVVDAAPMAQVCDPGSKYALVYERRALCRESAVRTMDNLGVRCDAVTTAADFNAKIINGNYTHVFIASALYAEIMEKYPDLKSGARFILVAEYGEIIKFQGVSAFTAPIFCLPAAYFLNNPSRGYSGNFDKQPAVSFTAPQARVLAVDDIASNLAVTEGYLSPYKMKIDLCNDGAEAVEAVKANRYDLVFMDHMMPGMNGDGVIGRIRALAADGGEYYSKLPVIALTANAAYGMKETFADAGYDGYLSKPIDMTRLNTLLETWIPKEKKIRAGTASGCAAGTAYGDAADSSGGGAAYPVDGGIVGLIAAGAGVFKIEGLDADKGISLTGGTLLNYIRILRVFVMDAREKTSEIKASLETDDTRLFTIYVHAVKSSCANIGADSLSEAAASLERAGNQNDRAYIKSNAYSMLEDLASLTDLIAEVIRVYDSGRRPDPINAETLKFRLEEMRLALAGYDTAAIQDISGGLQNVGYNPETEKAVSAILRKKLSGDYDGAISLIDGLLRDLKKPDYAVGDDI